MGVGLPAVRFLVECLVVPDPYRGCVEKVGRHLAQACVEGQSPNVDSVLPEVHALDEALFV